MKQTISYDEQQLMAIYNPSTRLGTIQALNEMRTYLEDEEEALRLATDGAIAKLIQEIMGHADIETTMNIYAEATTDKKKEVFASLEGKIKIS